MQLFRIILAIVEFICCIALVVSVLFQSGSKQGLGAIGGVSESFVSRTKAKDLDAKLRKLTIAISIVFIIVCIILNIIALGAGV
ncbi:MAG: preprotein translocase subunit SecG [Eubacteriales bacterium]|nr:preprotein translocase subunit SecG [Clostridiales bacterium]